MRDPLPINLKSLVRAAPETLAANVDNVKNEIALLSMPAGRYFGLNATGSCVWELIQQPVTVENLLSGMLQRFDVEESVCRNDLLELLERMTAAGLVEVSHEGFSPSGQPVAE
jgi:hypothetical protein